MRVSQESAEKRNQSSTNRLAILAHLAIKLGIVVFSIILLVMMVTSRSGDYGHLASSPGCSTDI